MDGVFMKKMIKLAGITMLLLSLFYIGALIADKRILRNDVVRLHVVANSDCDQDQKIKLAVKDAIINFLQRDVASLDNATQAKTYLQERLPKLEELANSTLVKLGSDDKAKVSLGTDAFDIREYDTFSLPSGIYDSLRVEIGKAEGRNWWCVVFPALCVPTSTQDFENVAASAGFHQSLVNTLTAEDGYEIRFFFLDCLGKLEKIFAFS